MADRLEGARSSTRNSTDGSEVGTCHSPRSVKPWEWHEWVTLGTECDYRSFEYTILRRRHPANVNDTLRAQYGYPMVAEHARSDWKIAKGEIVVVDRIEVDTRWGWRNWILKNTEGKEESFGEEFLRDLFEFVPNETEAEELLQAKEMSFFKGCDFSSDLSGEIGVGLRGNGLVVEGISQQNCIKWEHVNGVCGRAIMNEVVLWYQDHGRTWNALAGAVSRGLVIQAHRFATCATGLTDTKRSRSDVLSYDMVGIRVCWDFVIDFHSLYCDAVQYSETTSAPYRDVCKKTASEWEQLPMETKRIMMTDLSVRGGDTFTKEEAKKFIQLREDSRCDLPKTSDGLVLTDLDVKKETHTMMKGPEEKAIWLYYLKSSGPLFMYSKSRDRINNMKEKAVCDMNGVATEGNHKLIISMKPGFGHGEYKFEFRKDGSARRWSTMMTCLLQEHCKK